MRSSFRSEVQPTSDSPWTTLRAERKRAMSRTSRGWLIILSSISCNLNGTVHAYADISRRQAGWRKNGGADYQKRRAFSDRYTENLCARIVVAATVAVLRDVRRMYRARYILSCIPHSSFYRAIANAMAIENKRGKKGETACTACKTALSKLDS